MKLKALISMRIAVDGIGYDVKTPAVGEEFEATERVGLSLIECGTAVAAETETVDAENEIIEKAQAAAPENKKLPSAPKNKARRKKGNK